MATKYRQKNIGRNTETDVQLVIELMDEKQVSVDHCEACLIMQAAKQIGNPRYTDST